MVTQHQYLGALKFISFISIAAVITRFLFKALDLNFLENTFMSCMLKRIILQLTKGMEGQQDILLKATWNM